VRDASTRRGNMPMDPSRMLMLESATMNAMPASRSSASTKDITTASLVRMSSIMRQHCQDRATM
jgi:hypothetical protein